MHFCLSGAYADIFFVSASVASANLPIDCIGVIIVC